MKLDRLQIILNSVLSPYRDRKFDENAILTLLCNGVTTLILRYYGLY